MDEKGPAADRDLTALASPTVAGGADPTTKAKGATTVPVNADETLAGPSDSTRDGDHGPLDDDMPSRRFLGGYELFEEIARGGMGVVWRAEQVALKRPVALKLIRDAGLAGLGDLRRFRVEAEAIAGLDHRHIVPIYEVGQVQDQPFFSMKLIEGGNLAKHVGRLKDDPRAAAVLMAKVARAVHFAHQRAILHRDIKPSNILMDEQGEPYVTDFGLAKRIEAADASAQTQPGAIMGTPAYMAPEQARGEVRSLTTAADVYGVGATLYEVLTGRPPFVADSVPELLRLVVEREPVGPRTLNPGLDRDLEAVCLMALEKKPKDRYESAEDLARDLENWLEHRPVKARRVTVWRRVRLWVRRRPAIAALLGILVVLALSFVGVGVYSYRTVLAALDQANRGRYAADMNLARRAYDDREVYRARELLGTYLNPQSGLRELRGFEWYYLWKLCQPKRRELIGHTADVDALAYSFDGTRLASGARDQTVRIWDPEAGKEAVPTLRGHTGMVNCLAFSRDGTVLASGSEDGTVRVWEVATGAPRHVLKVDRPVLSLDFGRDAATIALMTNEENVCSLWDFATGRQLFRLKNPNSRDEETLLGNRQGQLLCFSPDGARIYMCDHEVGGVLVWDLATRSVLRRLPFHAIQAGLTLSGDGGRFGSFHDAFVYWDTRSFTSEIVQSLAVPISELSAWGQFNRDGTLLAYYAKTNGGSAILDVDRKQRLEFLPGVKARAYRGDGLRLATLEGPRVVVLSVLAPELDPDPLSDAPPIRAAAVFAGERRFARVADDSSEIVIRDTAAGRHVRRLIGHEAPVLTLGPGPPDHPGLLASGATDGSVRVWDIDHDEPALRAWNDHEGPVNAVCFLPDGRTVVSAGADGTVRLGDVFSDQRRLAKTVWNTGGCSSWYLSSDGRNTTAWPGLTLEYRLAVRRFHASHSHDPRAPPGNGRRGNESVPSLEKPSVPAGRPC